MMELVHQFLIWVGVLIILFAMWAFLPMWAALGLSVLIGLGMLREAFKKAPRLFGLLGATALLSVGMLAACSSGPPGLEACNYFRDEYLSLDAFFGITLADEPSLSLVRDEVERLNQLARDAEPEIGDATGALLESVNQQNEPYGDTHMDIQNGVMGACMNLGYWEERPPPN